MPNHSTSLKSIPRKLVNRFWAFHWTRLASYAVWSFLSLQASHAFPQLQVLSKGNTTIQWRGAQLDLLKKQLADSSLDKQLRLELEAQHAWLTQWKPGMLTDRPFTFHSSVARTKPLVEPEIDPSGMARGLRARLLGPAARPTARDTNQLQEALVKNNQDVGLRQLYLHWLDQPQYRSQYRQTILESAGKVIELLSQMQPQSKEIQTARAFAHFRRGRTLLENKDNPDASKTPDDKTSVSDQLRSDYLQIVDLVGAGYTEFTALEIHALRVDQWFGQALQRTEENGSKTERQAFLKTRLELLRDLNWKSAADEAEKILDSSNPE